MFQSQSSMYDVVSIAPGSHDVPVPGPSPHNEDGKFVIDF